MSLRLLRTLVAVFDIGSVVGAAQSLGYSAAAISRQIAALQRELGVRLFVPDGRGIRATDYAAELVDRARIVVQTADDLDRHVRSIRSSPALGTPTPAVAPGRDGRGPRGCDAARARNDVAVDRELELS